jgi:hypothetical protein
MKVLTVPGRPRRRLELAADPSIKCRQRVIEFL